MTSPSYITTTMAKAIGYRRLSKEKVENGLSLTAQRQAIETEAKQLGLTLTATFTDDGVSGGARIEKRTELLAALHELGTGDVMIVARRDRLARDVLLAGWIEKEAARRGASIVSAAGEGNGADDPASRLMRQIIDAFAEYERGLIRSRTKAALAVVRAEGRRFSGHAPFGYRLTDDGRVVRNPEEQKAVRLMVRWRDRGLSLGDISARLARRGYLSRAETAISRKTIAKTLAQQTA